MVHEHTPPEDVYTPKEIATTLKLTEKTVLDYLREGKLPGMKVGKHWRIRRADFDTFLQEASKARLQITEPAPLAFVDAEIAHTPCNFALWPLVEQYAEQGQRQPIPAR
jgi:excisionase family DNA binding protein